MPERERERLEEENSRLRAELKEQREEHLKAIAEEAAEQGAKKALKGFFSEMGVDIKDQGSKNALRVDFIFLRKLRRGAEGAGKTAVRAVVVTVVGAGLVALWWGIKAKLGMGS